jgi:hypothetical protein
VTEDLRKQLRKGLASYMKDTMANSERKTTTYEELVETTQVLNKRYQECQAEKARKQGQSIPATAKPYISSMASPLSGPIPAPCRDPNTMDVDTTKLSRTLTQRHKRTASTSPYAGGEGPGRVKSGLRTR